MTPTINTQQEVQPHFKDVWVGKQLYNILYGGRNSFKSSVVALKLARLMIDQIAHGRKANIVVIRKVGNTIRDSVFQKIQWTLKKFDQTNIKFIRQKQKDVPHVKFYWSYNLPRHPYVWSNEWVAEKRDDLNSLVDYSSYFVELPSDNSTALYLLFYQDY